MTEVMTDKQMEVIINLIADKFASCKNMEEVQQTIKELKEMAKNRVGEKISNLSHHRMCRSAYGGSIQN